MDLKLTQYERLTLVNQYRTLALLTKDAHESQSYSNAAEILERGYTRDYRDAFAHVVDWGEFSQEKCDFVVQVLNMYSMIQAAEEDGVELPKSDAQIFSFSGFDGNGESEYLSYASFIIDQLGRYKHLKRRSDLNAHMPTIWKYRAMLKAASPTAPGKYEYKAEDLVKMKEAVAEARA